MEAKDTIMSYERIQEIDLKNAESNFTDALYDVAREQAKISFKAGIKEVVEWINCNISFTDEQDMPRLFNIWKIKLKDWGVIKK